MRTNIMGWVQRLVALVFIVGLLGIVAAVVILVRQAEGVPPLPVFTGLIGAAGMTLLGGACLALISIANSMQRGVDALHKLAAQGGRGAPVVAATKPFTPSGLYNEPPEEQKNPRPTRPAGKALVAER